MKSEAIYMTDPYLTSIEAEVLEVFEDENEKRLILDKTVFYPMGGGQPTDQGILTTSNGDKLDIFQVMVKDGEIWHYYKNQVKVNTGDKVTGEIDWDRRYKNMKIHSAGHIIDFSIYILGYSPDKLQPQKGDHGKNPHIIYKGILDKEIKNELQLKVNELIESGIDFSWEFMTLEDLKKEAIYLQPNLPNNKPLRVLRLQGVGSVADGGTIVKNTSEVEKIEISEIKSENNETIVFYKVIENKKTDTALQASNNREANINSQENHMDLNKYGINLEKILLEVKHASSKAESENELTTLWRSYLGKDGLITLAFKKISEVPPIERKNFGVELNDLKNKVDQEISQAKEKLISSFTSEYESTTQGRLSNIKPKIGHLHPLTQTTNDLNEIFIKMGYSIMDGPEIETDEYCFQRLNLPLDHPARDLQDSIFIEEPNLLLRTQTSSIEARVLEQYKPPFKVVMPGRVYRNEKVNKSNHFTFHQYQLVCVQERVSLSELFATINHLFKSYYGEGVITRFRNKYYPEVEPGVGPDMQCFNCHGEGCAICKGRGWIEMGGAGIIHPNVLKMAGLDPQKWQGYAFGLGLDRWAMAKHNITDIRTLLGGNLAYKPN